MVNTKKYIIFLTERSESPPNCCNDFIWLVKSPIKPSLDLLIKNGLIENKGLCYQISSPFCESCRGINLELIGLEEFSEKRTQELVDQYVSSRKIRLNGAQEQLEMNYLSDSTIERLFRYDFYELTENGNR